MDHPANRIPASLTLIALGLTLLLPVREAGSGEPDPRLVSTLKPFFQEHCIRCHGPEKHKGSLRIDLLSADPDDLESVEHFQNIIDEITVGSMPPEDEPAPSAKLLAEVLPLMRTHVASVAAIHQSGGGRPSRRLTKSEYINSVYDLMGVHIDPLTLPNDGEIGSFDTDATALYTTDMHLEVYLEATRKAVREFNENRETKPLFHTFIKRHGGSFPDSAAEEVIREFIRMINRGRPADPALASGLNEVFSLDRARGQPFWEAIVEPMALAMCSMEAMFHFEDRNPQKGTKYISAIELANRLSYFLWRSSPDAELLRLADSGELYDPAIRSQQLERMIGNKKFDRFLRDFTVQWLELDRQDLIAVDDLLFEQFDDATKPSMKEETVQFMAHVIRENLPLRNLIDSDFVMVDEAMAKHYGLQGIEGEAFRPVSLPPDSRRGGLLTHAGILMQTGTGDRTSIVERGAFVSRKLLGTEPPPPPPLVEELPTSGQDFVKMTAAELVSAHRDNPQCASCHNKIDPLGMGLEEFDAIGLYRTADRRINPDLDKLSRRARRKKNNLTFEVALEIEGRVFGSPAFEGTEGLKKALLQKQAYLAKGFVEHLLYFANGRKTGVTDSAIVEEIVRGAAESHYLPRSILISVLESDTFKTH